jgi:hypothetical protein
MVLARVASLLHESQLAPSEQVAHFSKHAVIFIIIQFNHIYILKISNQITLPEQTRTSVVA